MFLPQSTLINWASYHHSGQDFIIPILQTKKKINKPLQFKLKRQLRLKSFWKQDFHLHILTWHSYKNITTFQVHYFYEFRVKYLDTRLMLLVLNTESCMLLLDCADQNKTLRTPKTECFILLWFLQSKSMVSSSGHPCDILRKILSHMSSCNSFLERTFSTWEQ